MQAPYHLSPFRSHFSDLETLARSEILNTKEEPTVCSSCSIFFFEFFLPRLVPHEKRNARHSDPLPARGVVRLDLSQTCDRAPALLGHCLDPGPGPLLRVAAPGCVVPGTRAGRLSEHQRPASFRPMLPFLRLRYL